MFASLLIKFKKKINFTSWRERKNISHAKGSSYMQYACHFKHSYISTSRELFFFVYWYIRDIVASGIVWIKVSAVCSMSIEYVERSHQK